MKWAPLFFLFFLQPFLVHASDLFFETKTSQQLQLKSQNPSAPYIQKNHKQLQFNHSPELLKDLNQITFQLTDGFDVTATLISYKKSITGGFVWLGRIKSDPTSYASFVINNEKIVGEVYAGGHIYRLGYDSSDQAYMSQFAYQKNEFSSIDDSFPTPKIKNTKAIVNTTSDDNFVDVILATATEAAANANAVATIEAMMAATNLMLADSCVNFRYRLLSVEATSYASGSKDHTTVLTELQAGTGALAALHSTRNLLGADLVQIFVDSSNIGVCGLAYRGSFGFFQEDYGFGLVLYGCPAFTLAHELGHNLSLFHDRYQQDQDLASSTAPGGEHYGYVDTINGYESIMSYNDHCDENGISCHRIGKFSNPRISHNGVPFGLDNFADNTDALNRSYPFVSNYRNAVSDPDPELDINNNCSAADPNKDVHCFIATATYGSFLHPKINILRKFRDLFLNNTVWGKTFIKLYYKFSPKLVPFIKTSPLLKKISLIYIETLILFINYSWVILIILFLRLLKSSRKIIPFVFLIIFSPNTEAQYAMSPFLQNISPKNPSALLSGKSYFTLSPGLQVLSAKGEPNGITSIKESGNSTNIYTAYTDSSFGINLNYIPSWKKTIKTTILPFSEVTSTEETSNLNIGFAFDFFDFFPTLGLSWSSESFLSKGNIDQELFEKKKDSLNLGASAGFGIMKIGGGLIYNQESGSDVFNSSELPTAQWISAYLAVAFDLNSEGTSNFESSSFGHQGFQLEFSYLRDPEVVELNGSSNIVHPETSTIGVTLQNASFIGANRTIFSLEGLSTNKSTVTLFLPESSGSFKLIASSGTQLGDWLFSGNIYNTTYSGGFETSELGVYLSIAYINNLSGGDFNTSF